MDIKRVLAEALPQLLTGMGMTVQVTIISLAIALVLGFLLCLCGIAKTWILRTINKVYLALIRGTPLIVQAMFIYFGIPQLLQTWFPDFRLAVYPASIIILSLNAAAYISEYFRGGIISVPYGQIEASRSLGLTYGRTMLKVVLPQAFRVALPSLVNQLIITLKDTSILQAIALAEIVYYAKVYTGRTMESFATWTVVGIMYLIVITILSSLAGMLERRLDHEKNG